MKHETQPVPEESTPVDSGCLHCEQPESRHVFFPEQIQFMGGVVPRCKGVLSGYEPKVPPPVHWTAFDDCAPACGAKMPEPPSRKPFSWPAHYPRVTVQTKETTCPECKRFVRLMLSGIKTAIEDVG